MHGSTLLHGDANHPGAGPRRLDRERHAGDQPAAGQRHQHRLDIRYFFDKFQAERPLTGDDVLMIEGR